MSNNAWVKVQRDDVEVHYYVMVDGKYVASYDVYAETITLAKKKFDAKRWYAQDDGTIHGLSKLLKEYPNATVRAVRSTHVLEETKVLYIGE